MRTVIFDLDGTLADTSADLLAAANACFLALGMGAPLRHETDQATAFKGGRAMLRLGFERLNGQVAEADVDAQFPVLLQYYEDNIDTFTTLYPGTMEAVAQLKSDGYKVGICTNKPEGLAQLLLTRLGVRDAFASLIGADTLPTRKPDPAPYYASVKAAGGAVAQSILIGDTVTDRETARAAKVPSVLVTFGPDGRGVADLQPEALLDHFDDLPALAAELLG